MKITIEGWGAFAMLVGILFWAVAILIQMIAGRYWPKKVIKKYYAPEVCAGCGKPVSEHYYVLCSKECGEIVKDCIE